MPKTTAGATPSISPRSKQTGGESEEAVTDRCAVCGSELVARAGRGRPARYCSTPCKREVEFEVRRLRYELADAEDALAWFDRAPYIAPGVDRNVLRMNVDALVEKLRAANARPYARRRSDS
jgi:hypothetical protein